MPELNGVEICEKIRNHYKDQDVIIIFLSARSEEYTQIACYDAGGDDYVKKPIKPRLLIKKIESYTKRKKINLDGVIKNGISINEAKHLIFLNDKEINLTTTLVKNKECSFVVFENGIAKCSIEQAYNDNIIDFKKPISCHLFPIRITEYSNFDAINYEKIKICEPACECGSNLKLPLFVFLKQAIIRKYGRDFYKELLMK